MTFDALALHAVRDELAACLQDGRIQEVFLVDAHSLGMEVYAGRQRRYLLASTEPASARVHLISTRLKRGTDAVTPLLLLLRKYVRDGWVETIEQPRLERVLSISVATSGDDGTLRRVRLIIEAMGRRSNVVLVDEDGAILDALKRAPPSRNPSRPLLPHLRYSPPPPQDRLDPLAEAAVAHLRDEALQMPAAPLLAELLAQRLAGFSPQLAREVAWRVAGAVDARANASTDWTRLRAVLAEILRPLADGDWQPTVAWRNGQAVACAPYPLRHLQGVEVQPTDGMSQALEQWIANRRPTVDGRPPTAESGVAAVGGPRPGIGDPRFELLGAISRRREQLERKRAALERSRERAEAMGSLREAGEAILASTASIQPGQESLVWDGRSIALDPHLAPAENAQRYFEQYRKARDASRQVPEMLRGVDLELAYLDEMAVFVGAAANPEHLRALKREMAEAGLLGSNAERQQHKQPGHKLRPGRREGAARPAGVQRFSTQEGFEILVGNSARANETVTFEHARPDDLWLHARSAPGAHVVVRTGGRALPPRVLERAARLAATNSGASGAEKVAVDWTERKYVRKQRGGRPGQVSYTHEQTLIVTPLQSEPRGAEAGSAVS